MKQTGASEHQRLASDPRANVWVAANAGSGKTRVLVERVIRLLLDDVKPERILCLTFTKAAASEMANRLFDVLGKWITCDDAELGKRLAALGIGRVDKALLSRARKLFTLSLETPGGLKIQTIHAFAERLLQLFPIEANVAPGFEVMDERAAGELLEIARRSVLADGAQSHSEALGKIISFVKEDSFDSLIGTILAKRSDLSHVLRAPHGVENAIAALRRALGRPPGLTKDDITSFLSIDRARYSALADALRRGKPSDQQRASLIAEALAQPDATLDALARLYLKADHQPKTLRSIATNAVVNLAPWIPAFVAGEQQRLVEANEARSDLAMLEATEALLHLAAEIIGRYEAEKRNSGRYDFEDLIARTGQLLTRSGAAQWVLYKLDGGIDHILIDEAQDTSPAQWAIVEALAEEFYAGGGARADVERTFFAVGDRKQSIFSFQGADPDAFVEAAARFELKVAGVGKTFKRIPLHISYRSTKWVLDAVDCVFAMPQARQGIEAQLDISIEHRPHRQEDHGLVELWPLVSADEKTEEQPWRAPIDAEPQNHPRRKLAAKIARRVASWIGRRRLPSQNRPVRAGDILILVQRRNAFFDAVIRELRRHGVAVAGADRIKLGEHLAVRDALALAQFALLPEDDYTLACVLKSPLVSRDDGMPIDDADLFDLAHGRGKTSLWQRLLDDSRPRFATARNYLERWFAEGPALSPFEFFSRLLVQSRADILSRLGPEANDPLDALVDLALEFERDHPPTLQAFLSWFASDETEIKRDMDQGADEVRVMTVHGAKGLESHIVILPDCCDLPDNRPRSPVIMVRTSPDGPDIPFWVLPKMVKSSPVQVWCDRRLDVAGDEYRRLLYVAMTRARDELYVSGWYNRIVPKDHCWYELVRTALAPNARQYVDADGDTLWRIGKDDEFTAAKDTQMAFGGLLPTWLRQPVPAPSQGRHVRPSSPVRAPLTPDLEQRIARGRLVHRLLEVLPELPADGQLSEALKLAKEEPGGAELAAALVNIIQDPHYAPYFTASGLSEVPIMMRDRDGQLISGQIDRLLVSDHEALIIDFKSDARPPNVLGDVNPAYLAQLAAYRAAVRLIYPAHIYPAHKVRAALLWTDGPNLMEVPEALLDRAAMQETRILAPSGEP